VLPIQRLGHRRDDLAREVAARVADLPLLLTQFKIHLINPCRR